MRSLHAVTTDVWIPSRPKLVPGVDTLARGSGEIQFGLDPRHAVIASGLPDEIGDVLRHLDGTFGTGALFDLAGLTHAETLRQILLALTERGMIEEAAAAGAPHGTPGEPEVASLRAGPGARAIRAGRTILVHGGGRLAVATAVLLATAGVGHVDSRASGTVTVRDLGSGFTESELGLSKRRAMIEAIKRANPATGTRKLLGKRIPDLVILADAVVAEPAIVGDLLGARTPHLQARVRDGIGIVGPLVLPGRTSCLRCADLHRADIDHCWPKLACQLAGHAQDAELSSVHAAAALTACQALRTLDPDDGAPAIWNATLEIDPYSATLQRRDWPAHPSCPCGAARTAPS